MIKHNQPSISINDTKRINQVLKSKWVANGHMVSELEVRMGSLIFSNTKAIATISGTTALILAIQCFVTKSRNQVIVPDYVCVSVLQAIHYCGATAIICDVNRFDYNLNYDDVKRRLNENTAVIIMPHTFGMPGDISKMKKLNVPIIEDCAQAFGASIEDEWAGSFGDIAVFSLYASKMITSGHGGIAVTKNEHLYHEMLEAMNMESVNPLKAKINFRMSDLNAALALEQLDRFDEIIAERRYAYNRYKQFADGYGLQYQKAADLGFKSNGYRFVLEINEPQKIIDYMKGNDVVCIIPIEHHELLNVYMGRKATTNSDDISKHTLSLPTHSDMKLDNNIDKVIQLLEAILC